jgi:hypothetical protein
MSARARLLPCARKTQIRRTPERVFVLALVDRYRKVGHELAALRGLGERVAAHVADAAVAVALL